MYGLPGYSGAATVASGSQTAFFDNEGVNNGVAAHETDQCADYPAGDMSRVGGVIGSGR